MLYVSCLIYLLRMSLVYSTLPRRLLGERRLVAPLSSAPLPQSLQNSLDNIEDEELRARLERISRMREATRHTD